MRLSHVTADLALEQAAAADAGSRRGAAGGDPGRDQGSRRRGRRARPSMGSLVHRGRIAAADSPLVARIRAAGAVIVGKTTTSEYGWKGESGNRVNGPGAQPVAARPHGRRLVGRLRRRGRRRGRPDGAGGRRRGLDPDPGVVLRCLRAEADGGPRADGAGLGPLGPGPDRPHGGRRRAAARRDGGDVAFGLLGGGRRGRARGMVGRSRVRRCRGRRARGGGRRREAAARAGPARSRTPTPGSTIRGRSSTRSGRGTRRRTRIRRSETWPTRAAGRSSSAGCA